jgi:hypothetical protein
MQDATRTLTDTDRSHPATTSATDNRVRSGIQPATPEKTFSDEVVLTFDSNVLVF